MPYFEEYPTWLEIQKVFLDLIALELIIHKTYQILLDRIKSNQERIYLGAK
jgi:hypothetical protein